MALQGIVGRIGTTIGMLVGGGADEAPEAYRRFRDKQDGMAGRAGHYAKVEACREVSARWLGLATSEVSFCLMM